MNIKPKLYIFEGIDNIGKTTLIEKFSKNFQNPLIIKFSSPPKDIPLVDRNLYQLNYFEQQFQNVNKDSTHDAIIWDRSHIGESVYGPMFRNYNPKSDLLKLESAFHDIIKNDTFLFLLKASPTFSLNHEDGKTMFLSEDKLLHWLSTWSSMFSLDDCQELWPFMNDVANNYKFNNKISTKILENTLFKWAYENTLILKKMILNVHTPNLEFYSVEILNEKITNFVNAKNQSCN